MLEKAIEAKLVKECKKRGWLCLKQNVTGRRGYPDRLIITVKAKYVWVELKTDVGKLSEPQRAAIKTLQNQKCAVYVTFGVEQMEMLVDMIERNVI